MKRYRLLFILLFFLISYTLIPISNAASLTLNIAPTKPEYNVGEIVNLIGNLTKDGTLIANATISFEIRDPKGNLFMIRAFTTGEPPQGTMPVEIISITPCDSNGNPKYTFLRGDTMGFKITFKNNMATSRPIIITINIFYCNAVPFKAFVAYNSTVDAGQQITFTLWPILIPSNAPTGTAAAYASAFSDLPSEGGLAYSPEKKATFNIISSSEIKEAITAANGKFNITFPLTTIPIILGNYNVTAKTLYNYNSATQKCQFKTILKSDVNNDGKVDAKDIAIVCKAFGTQPGDPRWNPVADLNNDGKVDAKDIAIVCKSFGITVITDP
ncbi:MAG: dockerin type I domain-containing protein [Candidatus Bathyarchaeia archaeon]